MFESADLDHVADKARWKKEAPELRQALLQAQYQLGTRKPCAVVVLIAGVDGAGKGEILHLLNEWMDPRHILSHGFAEPSDEERERPTMWRFWRALPPRGKIGIFLDAWYADPIIAQALEKSDSGSFDARLSQIRAHEQMLADEDVLLVKLWLHLSKDQQRQRFEQLEKHADTRWRVSPEDWKHFKAYDALREASAHALTATDSPASPWVVIPGNDPRYRNLMVARTLLDALHERITRKPSISPKPQPHLSVVSTDRPLDALDLGLALASSDYTSQLEHWQGRINRLARSKRFRDRSLVVVFEGWDAAGKGSAIRRFAAALDARYYRITPVSAPTEEEREQPYLWRFWQRLPRHGRTAIFDRSWYGRVLVERVEGLCESADWMRAYREINDFEEQLVDSGAIVCKFWLHISPEEQLRRFEARQSSPFKRFKITDDDWHNRSKRGDYYQAACEMIEHCSTQQAPWTLIEAEDKRFARIRILKTIAERLEQALD